jgi:hypothetical protein
MYSSLERVAVTDSAANRAMVTQWTSDQDTLHLAATDAPPGSRPQFDVTQLAGPVAMNPVANTVIDTSGDLLLNRLGDRAAVRESLVETVVAGELTVADTVLRVVPTPLPASVEFSSAEFAPRITSVTFDNDDPGRPSIVWTTARPTDDQTAVVAFANIAFGGSWDIVAPPNQPGALRYPDLPSDLRPTTTGFGILWTIRSGEFSNYADAHRDPTALTIPPFFETHADASGISYRACLARTGPP